VTVLHLDTAACSRPSEATRAAVFAHLDLEAETGGYVAEAHAAPVLTRLRQDLGWLMATDSHGVALVGGGSAALAALLRAWPLPPAAVVGVLASEWEPNVETLAAYGAELVALPADGAGVLDVAALPEFLAGHRVDVVHLDLVAAHRGLRQPVAEALAICRDAGVALWVDAAQGIGQVAEPVAADAVYGTSRKWLRGPRGVGFLSVSAEHRERLQVITRAKHPDLPPVHLLDDDEAPVAARVGLAVGVRAFLDAGPGVVAAGLEAIGTDCRDVLGTLPGWEVVPGQRGPITALRATDGQDVARTRARLLDQHGILTTASHSWRAPREIDGSWLRISPWLDCSRDDLERLARALSDDA
jgi:hercynylcysteine S-oxide lyase